MLPAVSRSRALRACTAIVLASSPVAARGQDAAASAGPVAPVPESSGARPDAPDAPPADALDPNSPMAAMPDLGVDWPDLAQPDTSLAILPVDQGLPGPPIIVPPPVLAGDARQDGKKGKAEGTAAAETPGDRRYAIVLAGLDKVEAPDLRFRFNGLSALELGISHPANVAQIDRRARADAQLLGDLLRACGYYDAEVDVHVGGLAGPTPTGVPKLVVTLAAEPGPLYRFGEVAVPGLVGGTGTDRADLLRAFGVGKGDPVNADKVNGGVAALKAMLGARGYAFATVGAPDIVVDHATHEATLSLSVDPGRRMRFGRYRISGARRVFGVGHVTRVARMKPGDPYNASRLEDLRRALVQTGLVSVVDLTPVRTADPGVVDVEARIEPAPPRTIAATIGYGTGEGASIEMSWQHRAFFPPEGAMTFRGQAGTQEQLVSAQLRRGNFHSRDQVLTAQVALDHQNRPAYDAKTATLAAGIERETNIIWQKKWTYSYGVELSASDERDVIQATGQPRRRTYYVGALPLSLAYDSSDDLLNPTQGYRLSAHVSPEVSLRGRSFEYVRVQLDGSAYRPVGGHVVLAGRVRLGSIEGAASDVIAPTRRLYAGGGGSVRGYGYQKIGPRDVDNDPVGGSSLAEFGLEARVRFGDFGVVPFFDGGNLYERSLPRFTGFHYGTGLGARYYTSFGPIRVDVGTPVNPRKGDSRVAVYVSLGQAF